MLMNRPAILIGISIGGFFDGILLHQILQWHHLFSGVEDWNDNVALLIATDGLFHLAMFIALIAGLWLLWRDPKHDALLGSACIGFGLWHVIDAVLSHWLLGIHRIRDLAEQPLLWDLGWLLAFGILPIAAGYALLRRKEQPSRAIYFVPLLAIGLGALNAVPPVRPPGPTLVAFAPGTGFASVAGAAEAVGASLITTDNTGKVWAMDVPEGAPWWRLYLHGAVMVGKGPAAGCLGWTQIKT